MTLPHIKTRVVTGLVLTLVLLGLWQCGSGAWIYVKAELAQALLQRAWADTRAGQGQMKPWPWADTWPVARLTVPSKDIDLIVLNGAYGRTLAFGPGHLESSAAPGSIGTTILTGHRDTHFRFLERLQPGETIRLQQSSGRWLQFTVRNRQVVDSRSAWIRSDDDERQVVLITCYPFDAIVPGGPLRYVVSAIEEP
ncbi:MAG: class GN sortase [Nitrospirota bacterium]|nr:class GN sortase [Nitrospirota bacterium]MDP2383313.1 class GN sortase [Nitrospirota bacterium]MDP3598965.1 class GN sortase [Nitrospirota bacterium]